MSAGKVEVSYTEMKKSFSEEVNASFLSCDTEKLKSKWSSFEIKESEKRAALEQALRDKVIELLYEKKRDAKKLEKYMEFLLVLCKSEMVFPIITVAIIGDILDSSPIPISENLFEFVENRVSIWKSPSFFTSCKNSILRMCNDLLRRLSKAQNTIFCGRILLFLAMFFPFSERSGLNIVSEFNLDTFMKYGMDEDEVLVEEPLQTVEIPIKLDSNFYSEFWSLQEYFRSPTLCYNKKQWKDFVKHTTGVLTVFKNYKLDWDAGTEEIQTKNEMFFTKFLTNQKLLLLQLSDTDFRRTIYIQFLILFQYLTQVKSKQDIYTLKADQLDWVKSSTESIHQLIKESPPGGEKFLECVLLVLKRDEHWSAWKSEGCPQLKKVMPNYDKNASIQPPIKKKSIASMLHQNKSFNKLIVPKADGHEIIDMRQDYLSYLPGRNCSPEVNDFLAEAIQQSESTEPMDIKDKKVSDSQFAWIALKLLSLKSPHFFSVNAQNPIPKLPEFVDHICRKIYREQNPGLLLPPLMPAPKTVSKADVKKESIKAAARAVESGKVEKCTVKLQKGQVKLVKTQSGKIIKVTSPANLPIKTMKVNNKIVKQIAKVPSPTNNTNSSDDKLAKSPEKSVDKVKPEVNNEKTESRSVERSDKSDKAERVEKQEKLDKNGKLEKSTDRTEKCERVVERIDRLEKSERIEKLEKIEKPSKQTEKYDKTNNKSTSLTEKHEKIVMSRTEKAQARSEKSERTSSKSDKGGTDKKNEKPTEKVDKVRAADKEKNLDKARTSDKERNLEKERTSDKDRTSEKERTTEKEKASDKERISDKEKASEKEKTSDKERTLDKERTSEKEKMLEKHVGKKEKSPGKRKRSIDIDSDDKESSPIGPKKSKEKREDKKEEKDDDSMYVPVLTKEQISKLAKSISGSWKKVAEKLRYKPDEIEYFESQQDADYTRALNLLLVWCSTEDDATPDNLRQCLKSLGLSEAVKILSA